MRTHLQLVYLVQGQLRDAFDPVSIGSAPPAALAQHLLTVARSRL